MKIVIGLIGAKGSGKTTAYDIISNIKDVAEVSLANKLKNVCSQVFIIPRSFFDDPKFKEMELRNLVQLNSDNLAEIFELFQLNPDYDRHIRPHVGKILISPRDIAQYVGTEVLRNCSPDIHCVTALASTDKDVGVVTDLRFPNEFEYFEKKFVRFFPVYIQNIGAEVQAGKDPHSSEAHLLTLAKKAVHTIPNNGSLEEFRQHVTDFVRGVT